MHIPNKNRSVLCIQRKGATMSILFPKVNKMPEWKFRPRFYDPEKERRKERMHSLRGEKTDEYKTSLHRGSFREARDEKFPRKNTAQNTSRIAFWVALLVMLVFCFYYLF